MGRDSNGNYSSPSGQFVAGTIIDSDVMNGKLNDIGSEITNSLDRNGQGGMLTYLRGVDGTVNLPAYSFTNEITLGLMRNGSGDLRAVKDGTSLFKFSTAENRSYVPFKVSAGGIVVDAGGATVTAGGLTVTAGNSALGGGVTGPSGGALVVGNGLTVTTGGAIVTAGGFTVTAGGLTVAAGGMSVTGARASAGTTVAPHIVASATATSATNSETFAHFSVNAPTQGSNTLKLTTRTINDASGGIVNGDDVMIGLTGDLDADVAHHGSLYLGRLTNTMSTGVAATAADPANALDLTNGNLKLSGTAPNSNEAVPNTLTPANIPKAWGVVTTDTSGNATLVVGFNVATVSVNSSELRVTFASAFTPAPSAGEARYVVLPHVETQGETVSPLPASYTSTSVDLRVWATTTGNTVTLASNSRTISFSVLGRQ